MELDVTHMVVAADDMCMLSGSRLEHGNDAGRITWNNSVTYAAENPLLLTEEQRDAARDHFAEYGAWSREEITSWTDDELQGIMVQDVAAAIREMEQYDSPGQYLEACERGECSGRLFRDSFDRWYFYLGS